MVNMLKRNSMLAGLFIPFAILLGFTLKGCTAPESYTEQPKPSSAASIHPTVRASNTLPSTYTPTSSQPTLTPLPTLSEEDAMQELQRMLETNGGCRLPCLWGIVPGESSWEAARQYLESFGAYVHSPYGDDYLVNLPPPPNTPFTDLSSLDITFTVENNVVVIIQGYSYAAYPTLQLPDVLAQHGQPEGVWLSTYEEYTGNHPTSLFLFYPSDGLMIEYVSAMSVEFVSEMIEICLADGEYSFFYLWTPGTFETFEDVLHHFRDIAIEGVPEPIPIETATDLSVEAFYDLFVNSPGTACFRTPTGLWPVY
jgi:hypothetical protein